MNNKSKHPMTASLSKKMRKEIHQVKTDDLQSQQNADADALTKQELLKKFPKKPSKKNQPSLTSIQKQIAIKTKKSKKNLSKRTQTGNTSLIPTAPASPHKEGIRWIQTLKKQFNIQRKRLQKRMSKKAPK